MNLRFLFLCFVQFINIGYLAKKSKERGTKWWTLANTAAGLGLTGPSIMAPQPMYMSPSPLTRRQRRMVAKNPGIVVAVAKGARMAVTECKHQMKTRRWNCPTSHHIQGPLFGKITRRGCRETAFIHAITSAAVSHQVARACAQSHVHTCACGHKSHLKQSTSREWKWGGCSDNVEFGNKFTRKFVNVLEKGRAFRNVVNLHNNDAGRMHVRQAMTQECKCHGMSGSCTLKTCWLRLRDFRVVSEALKQRFDAAARVLPVEDSYGNRASNRIEQRRRFKRLQKQRRRTRFTAANPRMRGPGSGDLVYYERSPDFCQQDASVGFRGTTGRHCNATSSGPDGCDVMCCGRGYRGESYLARERCRCVFHWCCRVTCDVCTRVRMRYTCR